MDRSGPRLPSPWWVLLPGVLLALAGVRAVTAEMDRARVEARERTRNAAARVARAFETLIDESLAPLPLPGTTVDLAGIESELRHLNPRVFTRSGRAVLHGPAALSRWPSEPPTAEQAARDTALADALLRQIARTEPADADVAAALLASAADAVETPGVEAVLRVRGADADLRQGRKERAFEQLDLVGRMHPNVTPPAALSRFGERPYLDAVRLYAEALSTPLGPDELELTSPQWLDEAGSAVLLDFWGLDDAERDGLLQRLHDVAMVRTSPTSRDALAASSAIRSELRELAKYTRPPDTSVLWLGDYFEPLLLLRSVTLTEGDWTSPGWVGGLIESWTLDNRVAEELRFVVAELGAGGDVALLAPSGSVALGTIEADVGEGLVEEVQLMGAASGWRVIARTPVPDELPTSAVLLATVLAAATVMLGVGAFALSRAARTQARLAEDRRNFLDHVAHEVRTPAAALLALSEELERGHVDTDRQATYHQHLLTESRRLADLVEETLDLTRLEGGRLVAKREPADMRDIVRDAIEAARPGEGRVTVTLPDDPMPVVVDRAAVRRALRNLLDNALKHGAAPEPVEVTLEVTLEATQGGARVSVRDRGRGIPSHHAAHIFERFYRVPSKTHEVKGVGLGLALVKEVAEMHGGGVTAANVADGGAMFRFEVPLAPAEQEQDA